MDCFRVDCLTILSMATSRPSSSSSVIDRRKQEDDESTSIAEAAVDGINPQRKNEEDENRARAVEDEDVKEGCDDVNDDSHHNDANVDDNDDDDNEVEHQPLVCISFRYITDVFIPEHGGWQAFEGLTTRQVTQKIHPTRYS